MDKVSPLKLYDECRSLSGFNLHNFLFSNQMYNSRRYILEIFAKLFKLFKEGSIKPVIDSIHSFDNVSWLFFAADSFFKSLNFSDSFEVMASWPIQIAK